MSLFEPAKWLIFRLANFLADYKQRGRFQPEPNIDFPKSPASEKGNYLWIFCSTIGELNACKPLIEKVSQNVQLVLLTDRECYRDAYRQHFPHSIIVQLSGQAGEGARLLQKLPPFEIIVCEIPCMLHDAPCRLSYGVLREASRKGAKLNLINGWLYHYDTACKMDEIERRWFNRHYVQLFDLMVVQTEAVRNVLLEAGAKEDRVKVAGNIKFDSLHDIKMLTRDEDSKGLLQTLANGDFPVIVAGCISDIWEFELLLDAYSELLEQQRNARIVLAPRHPENTKQMDLLKSLLLEAGLNFCFKSEHTAKAINEAIGSLQVLVLDTIGELRSFYSCGDVCYVGRDHNILEPLAFGKPVVVISDWNTTYPSFPVYEITKEKGLVVEINGSGELASTLHDMIFHAACSPRQIAEKLGELAGGVEKTLTFLGKTHE